MLSGSRPALGLPVAEGDLDSPCCAEFRGIVDAGRRIGVALTLSRPSGASGGRVSRRKQRLNRQQERASQTLESEATRAC